MKFLHKSTDRSFIAPTYGNTTFPGIRNTLWMLNSVRPQVFCPNTQNNPVF